jgi:flagellar export protein FliJ
MKSLRTLLKVARADLETLRRALGDQIARQTALEQRILGHEQTIQSEQQLAQRDYESQRAYGGFAMAAVSARRAMESEGDVIAAEMERLRVLITDAHVEARKFERLIELQEAREKAAREKREAADLDEFATMRAARTNPR